MSRVIGRPFKKGESGNPGGKAGLPAEIREARKNNQASLVKLLMIYTNLTYEEAQRRLSIPETSQIEQMIQGLIMKAVTGDVFAFKYIIDTMVGKIPESNEDDFTEEDLRILKRVKEIREEENSKEPTTKG